MLDIFRAFETPDPELVRIVAFSLGVSLSASMIANVDRRASGRRARRRSFPGAANGHRARQRAAWPAAGRGRARDLSRSVAVGTARLRGPFVHAHSHGHSADAPRHSDRDRPGTRATATLWSHYGDLL